MSSAVSEVTVERDEDGLTVLWEITGDDVGVDVSVGSTPDGADHEHTVTVPSGGRSVHLDGWPDFGDRRLYVSVTPSPNRTEDGGGFRGQGVGADLVPKGAGLVAGERRVRFEQVTNFRDLGGYPTTTGKRTRWGRVFRSDALHRLTQGDLLLYQSLGLRAVYDLRHDAERERYPNPFPSVSLSLLANVAVGGPRPDSSSAAESLASAPQDAVDGERVLRDAYVGMLADVGPLFGRLLSGLADDDGLPAVFHCTGGKDRTGMSAALLLELLGVPRSMVLDDYELTSQFRRREHQMETYENLLAIGMSPDAAGAVLGTPRWVMEDALKALDNDFGGVERYLTERAGMPDETLDKLRILLTD